MSRYAVLISTLEAIVSKQGDDTEYAIGELTDDLQNHAFVIYSILISLPFLQPFPLGLFALIGSAAYWSLGRQLFLQQQTLALPNKISRFKLKKQTINKLIKTCLWFIRLLHSVAKPRFNQLFEPPWINKIGGFIYLATGALIAIPLGGVIPFRNLFPALAILCFTMATVEEDGLLLFVSMLFILLTILIYSFIFYLVWQFGSITLQYLFN